MHIFFSSGVRPSPSPPAPVRRRRQAPLRNRGGERRKFGWRRWGPEKEEASAAAEDPLHQPTAPGTGGDLLPEQVPGYVDEGRDRHVDQSHRGASQGEF